MFSHAYQVPIYFDAKFRAKLFHCFTVRRQMDGNTFLDGQLEKLMKLYETLHGE